MSFYPGRKLISLVLCGVLVLAPLSAGAEESRAESHADIFAAAEDQATVTEENGLAYDGYIFKLKDGTTMMYDAESADGISDVEYTDDLFTADSIEDIEDFVSEECIEYIEPNYMMYLYDSDMRSATEPDDKYYQAGYQWNLEQMNVQEAWSLGLEGQDMDGLTDMDFNGNASDDKTIIAVIDSGLKVGHEDIDWSHILTGRNFVNPGSDPTNTDDTLGHGTFCTGLIMATKDNEVGVAGIAQDVYVMPLKVFQSRSVSTSVIISAINYATEQRTAFNESKGTSGTNISVINMSLGGEAAETSLKNAVQAAIDAGIIVICAAGNDGDYTASYPAQYAIGVGSTDSQEKVSYYSQRLSLANGAGYENKVWVMAPGEEVTSLYKESTSSYYTGSGTSFSTPEVAALAALAVSLRNDMTTYYPDCETNHDAFRQLLKDTAKPIDGSSGKINGQDVEYGWGLVDFGQTLSALTSELEGEGRVSVRVQNEAGTEIPNVKMSVIDPDTQQTVAADADGSYVLQLGHRYQFTVEAEKYQTKTGVLLTLTENREMTITMEGQTYKTRFAVFNSRGSLIDDPEITITRSNGSAVARNADGSFDTGNGVYYYTASAGGYFPEKGSFTVDDLKDGALETDGMQVTVTLQGDIDVCSVKLNVINGDGVDITDDTVTEDYVERLATEITLLNSKNEEQKVYTDGYYKLEPGTYSYTVENDDYKTVTGGFTITEDDKATAINRKVYLNDRLYNVYFDVFPLWAARIVSVTNGAGETERQLIDDMEIRYRLCSGTYRYRIESAGFKTLTGTFTVNDKNTDVELHLQQGSGDEVIDDGTSDSVFLTVNSSMFALSELQKHETQADYRIGGQTQTLTGILLTDLVEEFTKSVQAATSVTVKTESGKEYEIEADDFGKAMIAWKDGGLYLAQDGADALVSDPKIVAVSYHIHSETMDILKEASCTEPGLARYTCTECGETRQAEIPALGYDYDENTGKCIRCGTPISFDTDTSIFLNGVEITSAQMREYTTYAEYTAADYTGNTETHYVVGILFSDLVEYFLPDSCVSSVDVATLDGASGKFYRGRGDFEKTMIAWEIDGVPPGDYDYDNHLRIAQDQSATGVWLYSPSVFTAQGTEHSYGEAVVKAPTCAEEGYTSETCTVCGHVKKSDVVPATGEHSWNDGVVQKAATCTEAGQSICYCETCGRSRLETVPPAGHSWADGVCTECGETLDEALVVAVTPEQEEETAVTVTAPAAGWKLGEENTFVLESESACTVLLKDGDGYERLKGEKISDGKYQFTCELSADSTIFVIPAGDGNGDGVLDIRDIMLAQDIALQRTAPEGMNLAFDLNDDGSVTSDEVSRILAAALGKEGLDW